MKRTIIFATNNKYKADEIRRVVGNDLNIVTLKEAGIEKEIAEPFDTLHENATAKSKTIFELTGEDCFSEDTGLEVSALKGEPGVHSARYAGEPASDVANMTKLLKNLEGCIDRSARFRTVISLILDGNEHFFEGTCEGQIIAAPKGEQGFGYDPIFVPTGSVKTFAEMSLDEKNLYSHRKKAMRQLLNFLSQNGTKLFH